MNTLKQIGPISLMNLKSIPLRLGSSGVIVIGIAGVVGVLISILAMVDGLTQMTTRSVRSDRVIVVSTGANFETMSNISREAAAIIGDAPGIKRDPEGKPLVSAEALAIVRLPLKQAQEDGNVGLRGVSETAFRVRPELTLSAGRLFKAGVREVIVGRTLQRQFRGLALHQRILIGGAPWEIVGVFDAHGDPHDSEVWTNVETLQSVFQRNTYQSVTALLDSAGSVEALKMALETNPALAVEALQESDYLQQQSQSFSTLLTVLAYLIGGIMAVGAIFGALNALYSAVSTRSVEIATLRVLGFGASAVVVSVFVEALLLALLGGAIGACCAWALFNGHAVSTNGGGLTQLSIPLVVNLKLMGMGILWASLIGSVGAALPAIRAARAPLAPALRGV
jgi:putative ABC transport system permease protein